MPKLSFALLPKMKTNIGRRVLLNIVLQKGMKNNFCDGRGGILKQRLQEQQQKTYERQKSGKKHLC